MRRSPWWSTCDFCCRPWSILVALRGLSHEKSHRFSSFFIDFHRFRAHFEAVVDVKQRLERLEGSKAALVSPPAVDEVAEPFAERVDEAKVLRPELDMPLVTPIGARVGLM